MSASSILRGIPGAPPRLWGGVRAGWSRIAYSAAAGRDLRFDFLRGIAVFAMVVDHLAGPSRLYLITGGNRFYTSAAEAFVFISGLVVGVVYRRMAEKDGLVTAIRRLLARTWTLYVLAVGLTLVVLPLSELLALPWAQGVDLSDPVALVWRILTFQQTYYLVDVPLLYAILLALSPFALLLLHDGRTSILLFVSWLLWAVFQVYPEYTRIPFNIQGNYLFFFAAWQVLFFTGMVAGYHRDRISQAVSGPWRAWLLLLTGIGFACLVVLYANTDRVLLGLQSLRPEGLIADYSVTTDLLEQAFAKASLAPGRLLASGIIFTFLYLVISALWHPIKRTLGWLFLPLGQNALFAYSAHVLAATAIAAVSTSIAFDLQGRPNWSLLLQVVALGLLLLAIRYRVLIPNAENRRVWMAATVPLAIAVVVVARLDPMPDVPGMGVTDAALASDSAARTARAFGTPLPREVERARRFGTPVPAGMRPGQRPAAEATPGPVSAAAPSGPSAAPLPPPPPRQPASATNALGQLRASAYVGETRGIFREQWFYSGALDLDMPYYVYLPPNYGIESRRYPVLYMLHGGSADRDEWPAYGLIDVLDRLIDAREIRPMIMILPQGDYGYWVNHVADGRRWGDYVVEDLIRHVDATYRTLPDQNHRAIGGLSMGGAGALQLAFNAPGTFHGVGAHSPALFPDDGSLPILGTGEEFAQRDPVLLADAAEGLDSLDILLDIGEEDFFIERTMELHEALNRRGIQHRWDVQAGGHEGNYWERHLQRYLQFYDDVLH